MKEAAGSDDGAVADLLWAVARPEPDPEEVRRAAAGVADVGRLLALAEQHGLGPLLHRALEHAGCSTVLGDQAPFLSQLAEVRRFEGLLLVPRALAAAVTPLADAGLEPVVLKGPSLAARYPEPGLRTMEDIDLLLPEPQHRAAVAALGRAGWQVVRGRGVDRYDT
ncbi:MAG TPA: nucleotidyltransferase family protein, partial [Acidimicrobiales bacterium]|nr:nucleotidyltransferase family protein [Acidimicrobiales bacterium]